MSIVVITAFAGCGPKPRPVEPDAPDDPLGTNGGGSPVTTTAVDPTPEAICTRLFELEASGCAGEIGLTEAECVDNQRRSLDERGPEAHKAAIAFGHCIIDNASCEAASACVAALGETGEGVRACDDDPSAPEHLGKPVGVSAADYANRKGATTTRFSQHASTAETPIEVCGISSQMQWLLAATCDNGEKPFRSYEHAHSARVRNVGGGGRCGSIIDLYAVSCPEATYEIYLDAYICPNPEP